MKDLLPIPESLKGKEVREFIDFIQQDCYYRTYSEDEDGSILKDAEFDEELMHTMIDFYNQPLTPEMVTEYFEGCSVFDGCIFYHQKSKYVIGIFPHTKEMTIDYNAENLFYMKSLPQTLNQFINYCSIINLKWRE